MSTEPPTDKALVKFASFVKARELLRLRRAKGITPWTRDPVLTKYRFCNVNREHDAVTLWVEENVRKPLANCGRRDIIFNLYLSRVFNHPPTLAEMGLIFDTDNMVEAARQRIKRRAARGDKVMRGAYMMGAHGPSGKGKNVIDYFFDIALKVWQVEDLQGDGTLQSVAEALAACYGVGAFIANQVITDLRYMPQWEEAPDWRTFVWAGPGTSRGLNRLYGRPVCKSIPSERKTEELLLIRELLRERSLVMMTLLGYFEDINNLSNCFCEYDKYCRGVEQTHDEGRVTLKHYS